MLSKQDVLSLYIVCMKKRNELVNPTEKGTLTLYNTMRARKTDFIASTKPLVSQMKQLLFNLLDIGTVIRTTPVNITYHTGKGQILLKKAIVNTCLFDEIGC